MVHFDPKSAEVMGYVRHCILLFSSDRFLGKCQRKQQHWNGSDWHISPLYHFVLLRAYRVKVKSDGQVNGWLSNNLLIHSSVSLRGLETLKMAAIHPFSLSALTHVIRCSLFHSISLQLINYPTHGVWTVFLMCSLIIGFHAVELRWT